MNIRAAISAAAKSEAGRLERRAREWSRRPMRTSFWAGARFAPPSRERGPGEPEWGRRLRHPIFDRPE